MEDIIKANGKMANSTEKAYILMLTMWVDMVNGIKESELDGLMLSRFN